VAALRAHLSDVDVLQSGCGALCCIAEGGAACAQAVATAGGEAAASAASAAFPENAGIGASASALAALYRELNEEADRVAMELIMAEESQEWQRGEKGASARKKQGKAKKGSLKPQPAPATAPAAPPANAGASGTEESDAKVRAAADEALQRALAGGEYDALSRALEAHRGAASEAVVQQACAERDRLAKKRKKESRRLRKAHADAMSALPQLLALGEAGDAAALREGLEAASSHVGMLPALDEEVDAARARLEGVAIGGASAATEAEAATPEPEAAALGPAVELTFDELSGNAAFHLHDTPIPLQLFIGSTLTARSHATHFTAACAPTARSGDRWFRGWEEDWQRRLRPRVRGVR
jgi:hypothetical protein